MFRNVKTSTLSLIVASFAAASASAVPIVLVDPTTNDGSFEEASGDNKIINDMALGTFSTPQDLGTVWSVQTNGGTNGGTDPGGWLDRDDDRLDTDGTVGLFIDGDDSATRATTKASILGTNGYNTVTAGDTFSGSFDVNTLSTSVLSFGEILLSFDGGTTWHSAGLKVADDGDFGANPNASLDNWQAGSISYVATAQDAIDSASNGLLVRATINDVSTGGNGNAFLDNVQLSVEAVPEPGSLALLGLGGLLIARRRRD